VFDEDGNLISSRHSRQIQLRYIAPRDVAVHAALGHGKYISTIDNGNGTLVALPIPRVGGAVLTYSPRPELEGQLGIVHRQIVQAALFASLAGALAGLLVAMLIAARLRRIATAANATAGGSFDPRLHPWPTAELVTLSASGGNSDPLCTTGKQVAVPRWSPDGRQIAFLSSTWSDAGVVGGDTDIADLGEPGAVELLERQPGGLVGVAVEANDGPGPARQRRQRREHPPRRIRHAGQRGPEGRQRGCGARQRDRERTARRTLRHDHGAAVAGRFAGFAMSLRKDSHECG